MAETAPAANNKSVIYRGKVIREVNKARKSRKAKATSAISRGLISEKAAKRHLKGY